MLAQIVLVGIGIIIGIFGSLRQLQLRPRLTPSSSLSS
jgi:hypothetical protein